MKGIFHTYKELKEFVEDKSGRGGVYRKRLINTVTTNGHPDEIYDPDYILKLARIEK